MHYNITHYYTILNKTTLHYTTQKYTIQYNIIWSHQRAAVEGRPAVRRESRGTPPWVDTGGGPHWGRYSGPHWVVIPGGERRLTEEEPGSGRAGGGRVEVGVA